MRDGRCIGRVTRVRRAGSSFELADRSIRCYMHQHGTMVCRTVSDDECRDWLLKGEWPPTGATIDVKREYCCRHEACVYPKKPEPAAKAKGKAKAPAAKAKGKAKAKAKAKAEADG